MGSFPETYNFHICIAPYAAREIKDTTLMSQRSLSDHAGFRHTKYLILTLHFPRQNFLLIRVI